MTSSINKNENTFMFEIDGIEITIARLREMLYLCA
jgi:hypothetical protein